MNADGKSDETRSFKVLSPGTVISHYKIIEKLGEGGMGVVYKARDTRLDRTVALKFLPSRLLSDSEARERFEHEAKAASALNHPNIATIYEIDEVEGRCFIAMEYLEGGSLKGLLKAKDLSLKEMLGLAIQIGEGLAAAHESGVIHRDIKPDNIMLTGRGLPKIMDFGLAKLKGATKVTKTGTTLGTLHYMSPEQAGGLEVDRRSDIFSVGVILYEMVAGRLPFRGEYEAAIINSILNEPPEPLARYKTDVPGGIERIVEKALAKDVTERYQHADEVVADLRREKRLLETGASRVSQAETRHPVTAHPPSRRRLLPIVVPAVVAAVVILVIFVFEPFRIEMGPGEEASAQENSLAIMYFENMVDPEDTDKIAQMITTLLITDLSESDYMYVISRQHLYDILKLLGKEDLKVIDRTVASEVAEKAGVKWILTGSILKTEPGIILTSDISEASSGRILATQRITGKAGEDLFTVVDNLSAAVKHDLALPEAADTEPDRPVAEVTTRSPEAYRYYVEALDHISKRYEADAERSLRKALEFDSTFAMAYYWLADIERIQAGPLQQELIAKAVQYSDKVGDKEKHYISALSARQSCDYDRAIRELEAILERYPDEKRAVFSIGSIYTGDMRDFEKGIPQMKKAIEIDPLYKDAYNSLAYAYDRIGDFENSIWAINKYISLAPNEPNPYDTRGDIYANNGKMDEAIESYKKALELKPDFAWSLAKLGNMYLFKRDYATAERYYQEACSHTGRDTRSQGRYYLGVLPMYQGKFDEALEVFDDGIGADRMERVEGIWCAEKYFARAAIFQLKKDLGKALEEFERGLEIWSQVVVYRTDYFQPFYADLLVDSGDISGAEEVGRSLRGHLDEMDKSQRYLYWLVLGNNERAKGNPEGAIAHLETAVGEAAVHLFYVRFCLASAYLEAGRVGEAVGRLEDLIGRYPDPRADYAILSVRCHYLLGLAYEKSGWTRKAIEQYEEFLGVWKDADPGIPEVEDARERLAKLEGST